MNKFWMANSIEVLLGINFKENDEYSENFKLFQAKNKIFAWRQGKINSSETLLKYKKFPPAKEIKEL